MIISHKSKDIGILKSIGVSNANIIGLFSCFAFLVGLLGSCIGLFTGWLFLLKIHSIENWLFVRFNWQLYDRTIYAIGETPNRIELNVLVIIIITAIVACLAGALMPSWKAAKLNPIETLRVSQL
jgi:lipoprotein-releasing system permease protein